MWPNEVASLLLHRPLLNPRHPSEQRYVLNLTLMKKVNDSKKKQAKKSSATVKKPAHKNDANQACSESSLATFDNPIPLLPRKRV